MNKSKFNIAVHDVIWQKLQQLWNLYWLDPTLYLPQEKVNHFIWIFLWSILQNRGLDVDHKLWKTNTLCAKRYCFLISSEKGSSSSGNCSFKLPVTENWNIFVRGRDNYTCGILLDRSHIYCGNLNTRLVRYSHGKYLFRWILSGVQAMIWIIPFTFWKKQGSSSGPFMQFWCSFWAVVLKPESCVRF